MHLIASGPGPFHRDGYTPRLLCRLRAATNGRRRGNSKTISKTWYKWTKLVSFLQPLTRIVALKYHPDRNPGREAEVNTQFQIIQTAHEILSDPEQKAKHDASRGRGRFPGASGVKGNPWSNVSAQYPPPPRRNNANPRAPPSGAQRWQRFSTGVPPTAKQYTASDAESKKNAARAFENMRKGTSTKANDQPRPPPPPPPPRTESARQRQEASFGARKTGFHPRTTVGDEHLYQVATTARDLLRNDMRSDLALTFHNKHLLLLPNGRPQLRCLIR